MKQKAWKDLSTRSKIGTTIMAFVQIALLASALWDIRHRPAQAIKGSKRMWVAIAFINFIGPIAYFLVGRKASDAPQAVKDSKE